MSKRNTGHRVIVSAVLVVALSFPGITGMAAERPAEKPRRADDYFPPPESEGGWRALDDMHDVRRVAGMDPVKLDGLKQWLLKSDGRNFAAVVIRRGYTVLQVERGNSARTDSRRVASVSKAICATVTEKRPGQLRVGRLAGARTKNTGRKGPDQ